MRFWQIILILLLPGPVSADFCAGGLDITDINDKEVGDDVEIKVYVTVDAGMGYRNLDITLKNPEDEVIAVWKAQLENDTNRALLEFDVDDYFIDGEYRIDAILTIRNATQPNQTICTEVDYYEFEIESDREKYGGSHVELEILPEFKFSKKEQFEKVCDNWGICYNLTFTVWTPGNLNITVKDPVHPNEPGVGVLTDFSAEVRPGVPLYGYQFLEGIVDQMKLKDEQHADYIKTTKSLITDLKDANIRWLNLTETLKRENLNLTTYASNCQNQKETYHTQYVNCNEQKETLEKGRLTYTQGILLFVAGVIFAFILLVIMSNKRTGEMPPD